MVFIFISGKMVENGHPVAINLVPKAKRIGAWYELATCEQLHVYKNPQVEISRIPNVYHHSK